MGPADRIGVSVVLALPERQFVVRLLVSPGTTVADVVAQSALLDNLQVAERSSPLSCAIYGRLVPLAYQVAEGDRIDILRPLRMDPKERRRAKAATKRSARES